MFVSILFALAPGLSLSPPLPAVAVQSSWNRPSRARSLGARELQLIVADRRYGLENRFFALEQLAALEDLVDLESILALRESVRGPWVADYVRCLCRAGPEGLEMAEKYLKKRYKPQIRAEAVYGKARMDPEGGESFARRILRDPELPKEMRVAALAGLADRDSPFARVEALRRLAIAEGPLLLQSLRVLRSAAELEDVPYLIDLLYERSGRPANEAVLLLQELTGYRVGNDPRAWRYWMLRHKVEGTPFRREPKPGEDRPSTATYMGIPILGDKIVFVLDSSGSMEEPLPERRVTRGAQAVEELVRLLPRLPITAWFDIVFFESSVSSYARELVEKSEENVERTIAWLRRNRFEGATNLFGGLETAIGREGVEELIVLSDGAPTAGEITDTDRILARVARWNRFRLIRINSISLGADSVARDFLYRLAKQNDGICRIID